MEIKQIAFNHNLVENIDRPERYLLEITDILTSYNLKWYLSFGTALGLYRDNDFIPQDSDIDISIIENSQDKIKLIISDIQHKYLLVKEIIHNDKYQQAAFLTPDGFIIDLSFYYIDPYNENQYITIHEEGQYIDPVNIIGEPKMINTKYGNFPMAEKIVDYLKARYGDWQTPQYGKTTSSIRN